ncbi:porin family protein [Chryseobacterium sp. GP-SGM7]|uniref:porin family protein n=1 Tax=Chryseobacterium sp. GP-SGM7 TaxID=3411323 RepID=UPI003B9639E8
MKKKLLGIAIVMSSLVFAQDKPESQSPRFGIKAGFNLSSINVDGFEAKPGIYGGVFANIPVSTYVNVQPEVLYNAAGAKLKDVNKADLNLEYISVPVMIQYNILPELYVEAGPQLGVAINKKIRTDGGSAEVKEYFKDFDFGVGFGAGYYFGRNFGITTRYIAGVMDVSQNNPREFIRNNVFQAGIVYKF